MNDKPVFTPVVCTWCGKLILSKPDLHVSDAKSYHTFCEEKRREFMKHVVADWRRVAV